MIVECSDCLKKFNAKPIEKPLGNGGAQLFLSCAHCGAETHIAHISAHGVALREELYSLRVKRGRETTFKRTLELYQAEVQRATWDILSLHHFH